jgi:hypothetical protein
MRGFLVHRTTVIRTTDTVSYRRFNDQKIINGEHIPSSENKSQGPLKAYVSVCWSNIETHTLLGAVFSLKKSVSYYTEGINTLIYISKDSN